MSLLATLLLIGAGTTALWLVLTTLVLVRKAGRDRREMRSTKRRADYAEALRSGDASRVTEALAGLAADGSAQFDMIVTLRSRPLDPVERSVVRNSGAARRLAEFLQARSADRDPLARGRAVLLLAQLGLDGADAAGARLLGDEDADVRLAACAALAMIATPEAATALIAALSGGRLRPERLIERLGAAWAVGELLSNLERTSDPAVRAAIARALGLAPDKRSILPLRRLLESAGESERINAARSLGTSSAGAAVMPVLRTALADASAPVRAQAARAIGALRDPAEPMRPLVCKAAAHDLRRCLSDQDWWVRANSAAALRGMGSTGAAELRAALHDPDRFARSRAAESLALLDPEQVGGERWN